MYKFQTSRGPDRDAEGVEGEGSVPFPSRLEGLGEHCKLPQWDPGTAPAENEFWHI